MKSVCITLVLALLLTSERTRLRPGFNLFSAEQDVEIGKQVSQDAEQKLKLINDSQVSTYISALGRRLASRAPGEGYPYQFKVVNDKAINAFALPGGVLYINRGILENADNEAQLAGVMSHEISHVALRHGTNQMSKAYAAQAPLAINPGNRIGSVNQEITRLGGSNRARNDSADFQRIKRILKTK